MTRNNGFDFDITIVGAGMVGASLAHALRNTGYSVGIVEAVPPRADTQPSYDDRHLALSLSSQRILNDLDLWTALSGKAVPIEHIHVSDQGCPGMVRMSADEFGVAALGHVVVARNLGQALLKNLKKQVQEFFCPASVIGIENSGRQVVVQVSTATGEKALKTGLLILADGTNSRTREMCQFEVQQRAYDQTAIVCNVVTQLPHNNTAFERFTGHGPFALLPSGKNRMAMVFTVHSNEAEKYLALSDEDFAEEFQCQFGRRLGRLSQPGQRHSYKIAMHHVHDQFRDRVLLLGNSAHTTHPNAAQGFNLALRDVAGLAEVLGQAARQQEDPGSRTTLEKYQALRLPDQKRVLAFTGGLARSFYTDSLWLSISRNLGLMATELFPGLKQHVMRQGAGLNSRFHAIPL